MTSRVKIGAQVAQPGIHSDSYDSGGARESTGDIQGGHDIGASRVASKDSLFTRQPPGHLLGITTDVASDQGRITEGLIREMIAVSGEISDQPGHWWSDQLNNHDAIRGYSDMGHGETRFHHGRV